jgi:two-component system cell cycle sensor histidine kinase/response regulator CckA
MGTLSGGVAHDLNNALAPIMMGVELLRMRYPEESKIVDLFETSAKRGAEMVRQLLTFAKGAEGERVGLQPGHLVKELENLMTGSFPRTSSWWSNAPRNSRRCWATPRSCTRFS